MLHLYLSQYLPPDTNLQLCTWVLGWNLFCPLYIILASYMYCVSRSWTHIHLNGLSCWTNSSYQKTVAFSGWWHLNGVPSSLLEFLPPVSFVINPADNTLLCGHNVQSTNWLFCNTITLVCSTWIKYIQQTLCPWLLHFIWSWGISGLSNPIEQITSYTTASAMFTDIFTISGVSVHQHESHSSNGMKLSIHYFQTEFCCQLVQPMYFGFN